MPRYGSAKMNTSRNLGPSPSPRSRNALRRLHVALTLSSIVAIVVIDQVLRRYWAFPNDDLLPASLYGPRVLGPPLLTIVLAMVMRQVIPALTCGILLAAFMLVPFSPEGTADSAGLLTGIQLAAEHYLIGALTDADHIKVIVFSLLIAGMVGVIAANGGTAAVVNAVARWGSTRRRGQAATWLAGLLVFFDDFANAMIVGPSMRPVCDRLRISRAKLAYIVDSTAAPVASIALVGTWIGAEIGYIQDGLDQLADRPAFLAEVGGYQAFVNSIPYRFYAILALVMVLLVGLLNRDFGPMRKAENEAARTTLPAEPALSPTDAGGRIWYALGPVLVLVVLTLLLLLFPGWRAVDWATFEPPTGTWYWLGALQAMVGAADPFNPILYAALASIFLAALISIGTGRLTIQETIESATAAMSRLLSTIVILVLAWTLSATMNDLQLGDVAVEMLRSGGFGEPGWVRALPLCVFLSACIVAFATGTSWGTMGILCPAVVTISAGLLEALPAAEAMPIFYASVGAVLSGAVFGDHCSPISDTTVLSSLASECSLESHVWTQMPYALTVAVVSILCGDALCRYADVPAWGGLLIGSAALVMILLVVGRKPAGE
ncbi:MAG: Na+/H+ antiporter NhaC family protein [Phycisphaerae bacterium]|nr:Na+/H+ antiporter NhaC family protein [Phycisphaerae bacterium]